MRRIYNIGTECYGLIIPANEPDFLLPVKIILLEKYSMGERILYKVKIKDILEPNIDYIKDHIMSVRVQTNIKSININNLLKRNEVDEINTMSELLQKLNEKPFYLEETLSPYYVFSNIFICTLIIIYFLIVLNFFLHAINTIQQRYNLFFL